MRLEYVVVAIILTLVVFVVVISLLAGVVPSLDPLMKMFSK